MGTKGSERSHLPGVNINGLVPALTLEAGRGNEDRMQFGPTALEWGARQRCGKGLGRKN